VSNHLQELTWKTALSSTKTVLLSGTTIFIGTALLGLVAETVHQHVSGSGESPNDHTHEAHDHIHDENCTDEQCVPKHISFSHGHISLQHDNGPFGYFLNTLGGVVAAVEGYRLGKRRQQPDMHVATAAILAAVAHAMTHVALEHEHDHEHGHGDILQTITSPCHVRLLGMSVAGAILGSQIAQRTSAPQSVLL